jgi:anhydro-N-acetylmuramic acid kinase
MVYRVLVLTDSLKQEAVAGFVQLEVSGKNWGYELNVFSRYPYSTEWLEKLSAKETIDAAHYLEMHSFYGKLMGQLANDFIQEQQLHYQIQLIAFPGLPLIHNSAYTLGDGAAVAALTGINTVSDFKLVDTALGGQNQQLAYQSLLPVTDNNHIEFVHTALYAVLRWREENNMMSSQTGASRNSIGGAVWVGQEW